jgi:UDP-N-acetylglucosamine 2-epimerase (non-hydrolysing)
VKVATLVGTRPELIKLSLVIGELDRQLTHVLVHSGQNYDYELSEVFLRDLGIRKPDHFLNAAGASPAITIARVIERFDSVLAAEQPDAVLVLGDTNSCLGVIAAKRRRIPIFHMEAGNRCFDERVPEEVNRRIVDHVSDINLPYTEHARRYLLAEGLRPDTVIKTGSPMREILTRFGERIRACDARARHGLESERYFLVSAHREENVDDPRRLQMLIEALAGLAGEYGLPLVFSTHPRTRERLKAISAENRQHVRFIKPLPFIDYVALQREAFCVLSDSGTLTEEAGILGFPAVMLRDAHERPEGMDEGTVVMSGLRPDRVAEAVRLVRSQGRAGLRTPADYEADNVSVKVVRLILSYTDYVRRTVWYQL